MAVKMTISYDKDYELEEMLRVLQPILPRAKVKNKKDKQPHKIAYIEFIDKNKGSRIL